MTIRPSKTTKLSDTQLVLLSAASQRQDRCLIRSDTMTERAFARAVNALVKQGLVATIEPDQHLEPRAKTQPAVAITPAGLTAIGCPEPIEDTQASTKTGRHGRPLSRRSLRPPKLRRSSTSRPSAPRSSPCSRARRARRLDDLIGATGWLPHTTRAALTGLRQKGYCIERTQREDRSLGLPHRRCGRPEQAA